MANRLPVVVFNQTRRRDLGAQVAGALQVAGWTVTGVDGWRGNVPSTTVYYPSGREVAARELAAALPGPDRIRPRQSPMPGDALTVILHESYPGT